MIRLAFALVVLAVGPVVAAAGAGTDRARKPAQPLVHPPEPVAAGAADGDAAAALAVTISAELVQTEAVNGRTVVRLSPADHVVPGDLVIYTVQVRNTGAVPVPVPQFAAPVPEHTSYVADSATGPGADVSFSVDGGLTFDKPQSLRVHGPGGALRPATAADYTHIRWTLRHAMKSHSVAYARFRARLN